MGLCFLDTSALVKLYAIEPGSGWMVAGMEDQGNTFALVRATGPGLIAALARKTRTGELPLEDARRASALFRSEWENQFIIVELTVGVAARAMDLAEHHNLRGYDSIQLAAALELNVLRQQSSLEPLTFISADNAQCVAADAEGLGTENPNHHL